MLLLALACSFGSPEPDPTAERVGPDMLLYTVDTLRKL